jgi:hypothetical protein
MTRKVDVYNVNSQQSVDDVPAAAPPQNKKKKKKKKATKKNNNTMTVTVEYLKSLSNADYLTAIPAVNAFHPSLPILASATASGYAYLWEA